MNIKEKIIEFKNWQKRLSAYRMALSLIGADQTFGAPSEGAVYRSQRTAVLHGEYIKVYQDESMYDLMKSLDSLSEKELADEIDGSVYDAGDLKRELNIILKQLDKERAITADEYVEFSMILDRSKQGWLEAKKNEDYKSYAPLLQEVIDGYKRIITLQNSSLSIYDRMLDDHQPGWNQYKYDRFFNDVKERVLPLVRNCGSENISYILSGKEFPSDSQRRIMKKVREMIGFDPEWGKMGESEHPLTTFICKGDIRFTTKFRPYDPSQAILSTVHESGHAWFGHNIDPSYEGTFIGSTISAGFHESQSRLCENHLGRSRAFWQKVWPWFKEEFEEQLKDISFDKYYKSINTISPGLIRTESDEVTYPLHILIRYELEKDFMEGDLKASNLEEAWSDKYNEYLGIRPDRPSEGVLQDMHWPYAYFGYFPTYALGSAMAAQFFASLEKDLNTDELISNDKYSDIMAWLGNHVHRFANRYPSEEILRMATGTDFDDDYYFRHLESRYK